MSFLKNLLGKKDEPIKSYEDFWNWFQKNERSFYNVVQKSGDVEKEFLNKLSPKLKELKDGFFYLTGMFDDNTAELVMTADGTIKNIVFIEELVNAAPTIDGWKFTALKPSLDIKDVGIRMDKYVFNIDNLFFYSNDHKDFPDEIDITIIHSDYKESDKQLITNGSYIFLDNYLGELNFATTIDNLKVIGKETADKDLIPIEKLKDFLTWRQKEFIEKYEGLRRDTENDSYSILEAELERGNKLLAVVNTELLNWDSKASHPWVSILTLKYDGSKNNGMPNDRDYELLSKIEEEAMKILIDKDGYLNIGRQTANGERDIYFACRDFRKPSKVFFNIQQQFSDSFEIDYEIYKDKYWQTFNRFNPNR